MNQIKRVLLLCIIIVSFIFTLEKSYSQSINDEKEAIRIQKCIDKSYNPEYKKDFARIYNKAMKYAAKKYKPGAVAVMDIDETTLDNRKYYKLYKIYTEKDWHEWIKMSEAEPFEEAVNFINRAKEKGYKIIFITGRTESQCGLTVENLKKYNIQYDEIICRPDNISTDLIGNYKLNTRKNIKKQGLNIILNIGDQKSDFRGGYGKAFKLPNKIYTVP